MIELLLAWRGRPELAKKGLSCDGRFRRQSCQRGRTLIRCRSQRDALIEYAMPGATALKGAVINDIRDEYGERD